ncbi:MAG: hypothetical protein AAF762_08085, partial [Pseudomonadota bacterium]
LAISNQPPLIPYFGETARLSEAPQTIVAPVLTAAMTAIARAPVPATLAPAPGILDVRSVDTAPPAAPQTANATAPPTAQQVVYSHWDVEMPFTSELVRVRNADTINITAVSPTADLSISGAWIAPGVTIYSYNGERLMPDTPLSVHVLTGMTIDPDGYARATLRYQPPDGPIDRGLLAVPVVRDIGLADGTVLRARVVDRDWTVTVASFGETTEGTLRVGDQLLQEITTGTQINGHEDVTRAFDLLASRNADTARFNVLRAGTLTTATLQLARQR